MNRFIYLVRTLSRTKKKDYENYVVNAVYNRIACLELVPVTQQYIRNPNVPGGYYLIDLYFPQLNIGIECDEAYHKNQRIHDNERELTIIDVLHSIRSDSDYCPLHVDISSYSLEDINKKIDEIVLTIKQKIQERFNDGNPLAWSDVFPENRYDTIKKRGAISVTDNLVFPRIVDVDNEVFGKNTKSQQHSYYSLTNGMKAWFPKLSVDGKKARAKGWVNTISLDGETIVEYNENALNQQDSHLVSGAPKRIVFANSMDPVSGIWGYRFVGVFEQIEVVEGKTIYKRVSNIYSL